MLRIIRRAYGEASAVLGLAAISFAIVQLLGGAGIGWVGTILAWLPLTAYLGFIVLGRPSTRTRTLWPLLAVSGAGVVVAAFAGAVGIVIAVSGLAALSGYLFWYSRQERHPSALVVGSPLPDFPLSTVGGDRVRSSVLTERPQVIVFFRGSWCPFCTTQLRRLAERYRELEHRGVGVSLISPQPAADTAELATRFDVPMRFFGDPGGAAAAALGLTQTAGVPLLYGAGTNGDTVVPTVVITDAGGVVRWFDRSDNHRIRPEPDAFLAVLDREGITGPASQLD